MPLFSSDRERPLWAWTLAVVVAIYSTLGLATTLLGALDERIQALVPGRGFERIDILFNVLAGVMAVAASVALGWARRFTKYLKR